MSHAERSLESKYRNQTQADYDAAYIHKQQGTQSSKDIEYACFVSGTRTHSAQSVKIPFA